MQTQGKDSEKKKKKKIALKHSKMKDGKKKVPGLHVFPIVVMKVTQDGKGQHKQL